MLKRVSESVGAPLFGGRTLLPVLIDAGPPDLRFQRLPWYPEFRGCAGRSGYPPMGLGESRLDHLHFTVFENRKPFVRPRRVR